VQSYIKIFVLPKEFYKKCLHSFTFLIKSLIFNKKEVKVFCLFFHNFLTIFHFQPCFKQKLTDFFPKSL